MPRPCCWRLWLLLLGLAAAAQGAWAKDYYDLLSVPRGAGDSVIKRAYRKLALKLHPDKAQGTEAEKEAAAKRFAEVSHAYEVLSNEETRRIYDRYGEQGLKEHSARGGGGGGMGAQDIFSQFFGGAFGGFGGFGGGEEEEQTPKGHDVVLELEVTLRDLYLGATIPVTRDKPVERPAKGTRQCNCRNKVVTRQLGPGMFQQFTQKECQQCPNVRYERQAEALSVVVEPGTADGKEVVFFEEGEPLVDGEPGDLRFVVRARPHACFQRRGHDLARNLTISLVDALTGFATEFEHLDGHSVRVAAEGVTRPGQVFRVAGEGMPHPEDTLRRGDLFVAVTVAFPPRLSDAQKAAVRKAFPDAPAHTEL